MRNNNMPEQPAADLPSEGEQAQKQMNLKAEDFIHQKKGKSGKARRAPLPLFLWLFSGYLLTDAGIKLFLAWQEYSDNPSFELVGRSIAEKGMLATLELLLLAQILLRALAARFIGSMLMLLLCGLRIFEYAIQQPETFVQLTTGNRMRLFIEFIVFSMVIVMLNRSPAKDVLKN